MITIGMTIALLIAKPKMTTEDCNPLNCSIETLFYNDHSIIIEKL